MPGAINAPRGGYFFYYVDFEGRSEVFNFRYEMEVGGRNIVESTKNRK